MKICVLGSEGFIGKPFCRQLRRYIPNLDLTEWDIVRTSNEDLRWHTPDFLKFDHTFFLAWDVGGYSFLNDPTTYNVQYSWNSRLMTKVFPELGKTGGKFTFVSSQLADDTTSPYGLTKRLGELISTGMGGRVLRLWNAYGVMEQSSNRSHVISDFVMSAVDKKVIKLHTDGTELRKFIHMVDIGRLLIRSMHILPGIYDAQPDKWISIGDVAQMIASSTGAEVQLGSARHSTFIPREYPRVPEWEPRIDLKEGLDEMVQEYIRSHSNDV